MKQVNILVVTTRPQMPDVHGQALQRTAPDQRAAFWRDVVQTDQALRIIRRLPGYARSAAEYGSPAP